MLRFRELEHTTLHSGIGVRLVDEYTNDSPPGWSVIELDIEDSPGQWRELDEKIVRRLKTPSGVTWFPWREHYRDARLLPPRNYRVRASSEFTTPRYAYDSDGIEQFVAPYDDDNPPAAAPIAPLVISLLPKANYPFAPAVPVVHGAVIDINGDRVVNALVSWSVPGVVGDAVLTDDDGEFSLPMRRAVQDNSQIVVVAERPPPPAGGRFGSVMVRLPSDLNTFFTIQIL